jgi:hypothetical protein
MVLKVLPILGPSKRMTAITTMATRARMIAYSTRHGLPEEHPQK